MRYLGVFLLFFFSSSFSFGQSQTLNGMELNGPMGYTKLGSLHWAEGDNHIMVVSVEGLYDIERLISTPSRGSTYIESLSLNISGQTYRLGIHEGKNGLSIGCIGIHKNGFTYGIWSAISPFDFTGTDAEIQQSTAQEMGRVLGYMLGVFTFYD